VWAVQAALGEAGAAPLATLLAPFNHAGVSASPQLRFVATDPEGETVTYRIEVDDDAAFGSPIVTTTAASASSAIVTHNTTGLAAGTYAWRVRPADPTVTGAWSETRFFTVNATYTARVFHQTTTAQLDQGSHSGTQALTNAVKLGFGTPLFTDDFEDGTLNKWLVGNQSAGNWVTTNISQTGPAGTATRVLRHQDNVTGSGGGNNRTYGPIAVTAAATSFGQRGRLEGWLRAAANGPAFSLNRLVPPSSYEFICNLEVWNNKIMSFYGVGDTDLVPPVPYVFNTWIHLALDYDTTTQQCAVWVDGVAHGTVGFVVNATPDSILFNADWEADTTGTHLLDDVRVRPAATSGVFASSAVSLSDPDLPSVRFAQLAWTESEVQGTVRLQLEWNNGGTWALVPDAALATNSAGFATGPVSLAALPIQYTPLRVRAAVASTGTSPNPELRDFTISFSAVTTANHVVIDEVYIDAVEPTGEGDEFVELYNPTATLADLSEYELGDNTQSLIFPLGTLLASGRRLVVAKDSAAFTTIFGRAPDRVWLGTSGLDNISDEVFLRAPGATASTDIVVWGTPTLRFPEGAYTGNRLVIAGSGLSNKRQVAGSEGSEGSETSEDLLATFSGAASTARDPFDNRAVDGSGTVAVAPAAALVGQPADFTFTYSATAAMSGGAVGLVIPGGWVPPQTADSSLPGYVITSVGAIVISGSGPYFVTVGPLTLSAGSTLDIGYTGGPLGGVAAGPVVVRTESRMGASGALTAVIFNPVITVSACAIQNGGVEACNGVDDDCDPGTEDGSDDIGADTSCDGDLTDNDLCTNGTRRCNGLEVYCDDTFPAALEVCDGQDNDCNLGTPDGLEDPRIGVACDGADTDLCADEGGVTQCLAANVECVGEPADNAADLCNGFDDDCDPATDDGAAETDYGLPCEGSDSDACVDAIWTCDPSGGTLVCIEDGVNYPDLCDGDAGEDCRPGTADGSDDPNVGLPCDSPTDSDECLDGVWQCAGSYPLVCPDDGIDLDEVCDNDTDDDCDGLTDEGCVDRAAFVTSAAAGQAGNSVSLTIHLVAGAGDPIAGVRVVCVAVVGLGGGAPTTSGLDGSGCLTTSGAGQGSFQVYDERAEEVLVGIRLESAVEPDDALIVAFTAGDPDHLRLRSLSFLPPACSESEIIVEVVDGFDNRVGAGASNLAVDLLAEVVGGGVATITATTLDHAGALTNPLLATFPSPSSGGASVWVRVDQASRVRLTATAATLATPSNFIELDFVAGAPDPGSILDAATGSIVAGAEEAVVTLALVDTCGAPLDGALVSFSASFGEVSTAVGSAGTYSARFTTDARDCPGTAEITAVADAIPMAGVVAITTTCPELSTPTSGCGGCSASGAAPFAGLLVLGLLRRGRKR
jgi:hypothetical protein